MIDIEPKELDFDSAVSGMTINEENLAEFDFTESKVDCEDVELCTARYMPKNTILLIRKTWH